MEKEKEFNLNRAMVLRIIKDNEPIAIHQLEDKLKNKIPRSTIVYNIGQLKLRGLIVEEKRKTLGSPVYLQTTNKAEYILKIELKILKLLNATLK